MWLVTFTVTHWNQTAKVGRPGTNASVCHTCLEGIPVFWEFNEALVVLVQVFLLHFLFPQKHVQFSKVLEHQKAEMKVRSRK